MYLASLRSYNSVTQTENSPVLLKISDDYICRILERLGSGKPITVQLGAHAQNGAGEFVEVELSWSAKLAGFTATIMGKAAGVIPYDELRGARGTLVPDDFEPCIVCLSGTVDVFRRGVLDLASGFVHVFTASPDLSFLGAHAFLTGERAAAHDGLRFRLDKGDPLKAPLRVPTNQLHLLAKPPLDEALDRPERDPEEALNEFMSLTKTFSDFFRDAKPRSS